MKFHYLPVVSQIGILGHLLACIVTMMILTVFYTQMSSLDAVGGQNVEKAVKRTMKLMTTQLAPATNMTGQDGI